MMSIDIRGRFAPCVDTHSPPRARRLAFTALVLAVLAAPASHAAPVGDWMPVLPLGGNPAGTYDPVRQRLIQVDTYGRAWALDLEDDRTWTPLTGPSGPSSTDRRTMFPAFYDRAGDRMLVLTGSTVWRLDLPGRDPKWGLLTTSGDGPPQRLCATAVFDTRRRRLLVFGGFDGKASNDVWSGAVSPTAVTWTKLDLPTRPLARSGHVAVYDSLRDRMLVFGGAPAPDNCQYLDLWSLNLAGAPAWHLLSATGTAPCVMKQSAVYDAARDRMLVTGRDDFRSQLALFSLELSGAQPDWVNLTEAGLTGTHVPSADESTMLIDAAKDRLVLFMGGDL